MMMRLLLLAALVCVLSVSSVCGSIPAQSTHAAPVSTPLLAADGTADRLHANPAVENGAAPPKPPAKAKPEEKYLKASDFMGRFGGVPVNPTAHLQKSLAEDKQYIASILRAPVDLGDPTDCKHSDIVKDENELRKIALRINHRRVALRQQSHWIDSAKEGLAHIEAEISQTTNTARSLAEQLDALTAQKETITDHVNRAIVLKEFERTDANLMRLKDARIKEEVALQKKHNAFAVRNHEHNLVLEKLHKMRTTHGLALGKLHDPKPYRFAQEGMEAPEEEANTQLAEVDAKQTEATEQETETEAESETEAKTETEESQ